MELPVYTELSNFSVRKGGKKASADISVVLISERGTDPVDAINSVYQFVTKTKLRAEFVLLSSDRENYKFDRLLATFPAMRVLMPERELRIEESIRLGAVESVARNVFFIDGNCRAISADDEILEMYLRDDNYGIVLPLLLNRNDAVLPNVVKGAVHHGFIQSASLDIAGTAVPSLSPKYFCFMMNRDVFLSREIRLNRYEDPSFLMLELGYRFWKEGCPVVQVRNLKVHYDGPERQDITENPDDADYLAFHYSNILSSELVKQRRSALIGLALKSLVTLRWKKLGLLTGYLMAGRRKYEKEYARPVEDTAIFEMINRDMK